MYSLFSGDTNLSNSAKMLATIYLLSDPSIASTFLAVPCFQYCTNFQCCKNILRYFLFDIAVAIFMKTSTAF